MPLLLLPFLGDYIKPVLQEKSKSTIRKLINKPLKFQSKLSD